MFNKLSLLEYFILEKCSYIQACFIGFLFDLILPSTSLLSKKIENIYLIHPFYTIAKDEFNKSYNSYYFKSVLLEMIKPKDTIQPSPIVYLIIAMELYTFCGLRKEEIIHKLGTIDKVTDAFLLWCQYKEEEDKDKQKIIFTKLRNNNLIVLALVNMYNVLYIRYTQELYNLTKSVYYRSDHNRDNNVAVIRKALKNILDTELSLLDIEK